MAQSNGRSSIGVMAKYMHMFFPENKSVQIDTCDLVTGIVEGTFDRGESTFSFKATREQILELMACADKTKVITVEDKKNNPAFQEDPPIKIPPEKETPIVMSQPIGGSMKITLGEPPKVTKPVPPLGFSPPTQIQKSDRQRLSKPGEQELMAAFEKSWPNKYVGRKKLEPNEEREKNARDHAIEVARSYILAGDRNTIKTWVDYNNAMINR